MTHPHFLPTEEEVFLGVEVPQEPNPQGGGGDSTSSAPIQPSIDAANEHRRQGEERDRMERQREEEKGENVRERERSEREHRESQLEARQERERQERENQQERQRQERENQEALQAAQAAEAATVAPASVSRPRVISQVPRPITHGGRRG